jgi:hypothetical protein
MIPFVRKQAKNQRKARSETCETAKEYHGVMLSSWFLRFTFAFSFFFGV